MILKTGLITTYFTHFNPNTHALMSSRPQPRQDSFTVMLAPESSSSYIGFGCGWGRWRVGITKNPIIDSTNMGIQLNHFSKHMIRIWEVSIKLDKDQRTLVECFDLNPPPILFRIRSSGFPQLATVEVKYVVEKDSGDESCDCPICSFCEGESPLTEESSVAEELRPSPLITLSDDFRRLCLSPEFSDVVFAVAGEEIPAHKLVLTTRLPYFKSLFASGMRESTTNRVVVDDIDAPAFKQVLKFIYCGDIPEDIDSSAEVYLPIAEKYGLEELGERSAEAMERVITTDNVIERLILAHLFQLPSLKQSCFRFLQAQPALSANAYEPLKAHPDLLVDYMRYKPL